MTAVIDPHHLSLLGGASDPELREIIDEFISELQAQLVQVRTLADQGDSKEDIRELAHRIRGMAGSMGFKPLSALAAQRDVDDWNQSEDGWIAMLDTHVTEATVTWDQLKRTHPVEESSAS